MTRKHSVPTDGVLSVVSSLGGTARTARVTRDIDLLGWGANSVDAVVARIREVVTVDVEDGMPFDAESVQGREITVDNH